MEYDNNLRGYIKDLTKFYRDKKNWMTMYKTKKEKTLSNRK